MPCILSVLYFPTLRGKLTAKPPPMMAISFDLVGGILSKFDEANKTEPTISGIPI